MTSTLRFDPDGGARCVASRVPIALVAIGHVTTHRASRVEPVSPVLRAAFRALRRAFGDAGRVASWTRRWRCAWRVDLRPSGGPVLAETWRDRSAAIAAELNWLHARVIRRGA